MATIIALPLLGAAVMLQLTVFSRVVLLNGPADLVLLTLVSWSLQDQARGVWIWALIAGLMAGWVSAIPFWVPLLAYFIVVALAIALKSRVWQIPVFALFTAIIFGTLIVHLTSFIALRILGTPLNLSEAFNLIILPSLLLNLLLAIPINGLISELAKWVYPSEIEV